MGTRDRVKLVHDGKSTLRFDALVSLLEKQRNASVPLEFAEDTSMVERAITAATEWYRQLLPLKVYSCPRDIEKSEAYQYANIEEVLSRAEELRINPEKEPYLLWIPRMALCLPLPPFWRAKRVDELLYYYNLEYDVVTTTHPSSALLMDFTGDVRAMLIKQENMILGTD
jgi:hypothetical protein